MANTVDITEGRNSVTISDENVSVSVSDETGEVSTVGTAGPAGLPGDFAFDSGITTLNGDTGVAITFNTAPDDTNYSISFEQQALSGKAKFEARSIGEISAENKTTSGFTIKSSSNLSGVQVRWIAIKY